MKIYHIKRLLKEINYLGTKLFDLGYQNKRIAIVGRKTVMNGY